MSKDLTNITDPEHWAEWFEKCALIRCGDKTKNALGRFAYERYNKYLKKALLARGRTEEDLPVHARDLIRSGEHGECWYDLEDSYWSRPKRSGASSEDEELLEGGKVYKKFYLEEASTKSPEEARNWLEKKCSKNLMWTRCRTIINNASKYYNPKWEGTLDGKSSDPRVGDQLLSSEADEIGQVIFTALSSEQKILILAKANNVSLADPRVCRRLGMSKSALYPRQSAAAEQIADNLRKYDLSSEDSSLALSRLLNLLSIWAITPECGIGECLKCCEVSK